MPCQDLPLAHSTGLRFRSRACVLRSERFGPEPVLQREMFGQEPESASTVRGLVPELVLWNAGFGLKFSPGSGV
ncbi:hypothetical protein L1987_06661 [Smallanthus sonchifolius]|uniref:Uncharacterized protein n=1 Tax=Smallanthus sonchifolius TaxID=185202 RepID=A0ACB9JZ03_9ASTR|nr:hypothetical protein L1987_06661 [Smallanthus sonchifolius]